MAMAHAASPRQLKRAWQEELPDQLDAQHPGQQGEAAGAPPRQRRRLTATHAGLATPELAAHLGPSSQPAAAPAPLQQSAAPPWQQPPCPWQQQQAWAQQTGATAAWQPPAGPDGGGSEPDDDIEVVEPAPRRARSGTPEYRLAVPLPPPRPLAPQAPAWPPHSPDAWALVPYAPSLAPCQVADAAGGGAHALQHAQIQQLLRAAQGPQLRFDHEQPLPDVDAAMATDSSPAPSAVFEELPMGSGDAMEE